MCVCSSLALMFGEDYHKQRDELRDRKRNSKRQQLHHHHPHHYNNNNKQTNMDLTFALSAIIFTLLAIVVATSLFNNSSSAPDFANARSYFGCATSSGSSDTSGGRGGGGIPKMNGHVPENQKKNKIKKTDDWCEMSGSSHDHWDVVKSVLSEEAQPNPLTEELATSAEHSSSSSSSSLSVPRHGSRNMSLEVDPSFEASSGRVRRSFIGLSDTELLKCAFSHPQTEGATESPEINDKMASNSNDSLKYVPGKARSHHLKMMMSKEELEEEQRVQREQLSAIFQLLKDNQETFGDVSEGDMEEQLRLYSI